MIAPPGDSQAFIESCLRTGTQIVRGLGSQKFRCSKASSSFVQLGVAIGIASVLAIAGAAKLFSSSQQIYLFGFDLNHMIYFTVALGEIAVATFLICNYAHSSAWVIVSAVFVLFLAYSYSNYTGSEKCGCMGELSISTFYVRILNIFCLSSAVLVLLWKLSFEQIGRTRSLSLKLPICMCMVVSSLVAATGVIPLADTGSPNGLTFESRITVDEYTPTSGQFICSVRICNSAGRAIRLVGFQPSCGTKILAKMPLTIASQSCAHIPIISTLPVNNPNGVLELTYYADIAGRLIQKEVVLEIGLGGFASCLASNRNGFLRHIVW